MWHIWLSKRDGNAVTIITDGLKRLEYRGYDSIEVAMIDSDELQIRKDAGHLEDVVKRLGISEMKGKTGVGHTW